MKAKIVFSLLFLTLLSTLSTIKAQTPYLVNDLSPGNANSYPTYLTDVNGTLFFTTWNGLWKSDGTNAGTVLLKAGLSVIDLININGTLFLAADDGSGMTLWKSDGTVAGTVSVTSGMTMYMGTSFLTNFNGVLFFSAVNFTVGGGKELWKSDGTAAGTVMVKDVYPGSNGSDPGYICSMNNMLYFSAKGIGVGYELWKSDGTDAGTTLIADINPGNADFAPQRLTNINSTIFFNADDGINGVELWKTDGSLAGTSMIKNINAGTNSSFPYNFTLANGTVMFRADDGGGAQLWKTDGTLAGTTMVLSIGNFASPDAFIVVNNTLFFQATNFAAGRELWKSDGSSIGTVVVKDIYPGNTGSVLNQSLANVNGILYFTANDGTNGSELWKSDGTDAGTVMVYDINPGNADAEPVYYTLSGNNLFFSANEIINGAELWVLNTSGVAVPAPPSNLIVTPLRLQNATVASIIQLDWTDNSSNETGFHIERSLNGTSGWTLAGSVLTDITNFADTGLTASTAYYYQVNAYNAGGGSTYSNIANATTTGIEGALNKPVLCFVYPNPVNSTATLNISGIVKSFENTQFIIYNTFGIKVRELTVTSYQVTFEKVELASGLYHFQLINDAEIISTGKLIFQ